MLTASWLVVLVALSAVNVSCSAAAGKLDSSHHSGPVRSSIRISERKCEEYTRGTTCKSSYENIDPTVVETAKLGEFPHLAIIATKNGSNPAEYICTGSLISPRFVLTVAHCAKLPFQQNFYVILGDLNLDPSVEDGANPLQVQIKAVQRHPKYIPRKIYNDIALLELASELAFNANIRPACLGTEERITGHTTGVISTIERDLYNELKQQVIVKVSAFIKGNDVCNTSFSMHRRVDHGIDATQICGQEATGNSSECKAIGGSPLQVISNGTNGCAFYVIGLTSFGALYCVHEPTVFTRVSSYVDWIESVVWPEE